MPGRILAVLARRAAPDRRWRRPSAPLWRPGCAAARASGCRRVARVRTCSRPRRGHAAPGRRPSARRRAHACAGPWACRCTGFGVRRWHASGILEVSWVLGRRRLPARCGAYFASNHRRFHRGADGQCKVMVCDGGCTIFSHDWRWQPAVLVTVDGTQGSAPREAGAWMAVFADAVIGTIGGGHLEFEAIAHARRALCGAAATAAPQVMRFALGPSLGQCCGGVVHLRFEAVSAGDLPALRERLAPHGSPVALFGGGHVGQALVRLLGTLPFQVHWIDSRDEIFPGRPARQRALRTFRPGAGRRGGVWRPAAGC